MNSDDDIATRVLCERLTNAGCGYPRLRGRCGNLNCSTCGCGVGAGWACCGAGVGWTCCRAGAGWEIPHAGKWVLSQSTWTWSAQKSCSPALPMGQ